MSAVTGVYLLSMQKIRAIGPVVGAGEALKDRKTHTHILKQYIWIRLYEANLKLFYTLESGLILTCSQRHIIAFRCGANLLGALKPPHMWP